MLAEELDVPLPNLSYHMRQLVQLGLVKLVDTKPRRGAIEHYYKAAGRVRVTDKAWGEVPDVVKEAMVGATLRQVGELVDAAVENDGFSRAEAHLSRQPVKLDKKGWKDLSKRVAQLHEDVQRIQTESDKRRSGSNHEDEINAGIVLMLFEAPPVEEPTPKQGAKQDGHKRSQGSRRKRATA
jgi:DNA-binding transcriptional ArsR family regulator